jgi:DNA-binding MarR family transcriptional regulator
MQATAADATDAVVTASRVLVSVAARSIADLGDVTLAQHRTLVVLAQRGPQPVGALADALAVNPSTVTRMVERLVRQNLVERNRSAEDRREVVVGITHTGRRLVDEVTARRRAEVTAILRRMTNAQQVALVASLRAFAEAAGEVPEQAWSLGWGE